MGGVDTTSLEKPCKLGIKKEDNEKAEYMRSLKQS
jgi:hypothetical protein